MFAEYDGDFQQSDETVDAGVSQQISQTRIEKKKNIASGRHLWKVFVKHLLLIYFISQLKYVISIGQLIWIAY